MIVAQHCPAASPRSAWRRSPVAVAAQGAARSRLRVGADGDEAREGLAEGGPGQDGPAGRRGNRPPPADGLVPARSLQVGRVPGEAGPAGIAPANAERSLRFTDVDKGHWRIETGEATVCTTPTRWRTCIAELARRLSGRSPQRGRPRRSGARRLASSGSSRRSFRSGS